ncbi:MAG: AraC family transcriptional regulator [Myxococcales bacterium]|nr:AraC family transcriptional regulator [Myxococcales bacterium]
MTRGYAMGPEARVAVMTLLRELQDALDEPWTLAAMAARAGYDPFHFARGFVQVVGQPPLRYLRGLRLERAAHELVFAPEKRLIDIGVAAGYASSEAFRRAFVRAFGVAPAVMRARPRGQGGARPRATAAGLARPAGSCGEPAIVRFGPLTTRASVLAERFDAGAIAEAWRELGSLQPPAGAWELAAATAPWGFTRPGRPREYRCVRLGWRGAVGPGMSAWGMRAGWFARFGYAGSTPGIQGLMDWIFRDWLPGSMLRWRFAPVVTLFDPGVWTESRYERSRCEVYVPVQSVGVGAHRPAG